MQKSQIKIRWMSALCALGFIFSHAEAQVQSSCTPEMQVQFSQGILAIHANCTDFTLLMQEIARATGVKISGAPPDSVIFGNFGPGPVSEVFADLLTGTGTNMMYMEHHDRPNELIITPRTGRASPPSPIPPAPIAPSMPSAPTDAAPAIPPLGVSAAQHASDPSAPAINLPNIPAFESAPKSAPATNAAPAGSVQTPEQIFERLKNKSE
jgi:hypothetical protein